MGDLGFLRIAVLLSFVAAVLISLAMTPVSVKIAKAIGAIDIPQDKRRMHKEPIPRFGGFAIFVSTIASLFLIIYIYIGILPYGLRYDEPVNKLFGVIVGGTLMYLIGAVDDIRGLRAIVKFILQIVAATVTFLLGVRIPAISAFGFTFSEDTIGGLIVSYLVTMIWIVVITNTINLIDGLDGLAAGVSAIACFSIAYSAYIAHQYTVSIAMVAVAGAALGFLPFNIFPAKSFMGDGGALFVGFMLASVSVIGPAKGATIVATIVPVLVLGLPIFDVLFAVTRRLLHGKSIFAADKGHLHHQLTRIGMGQRRSVLMLYGISGIMGISAINFSRQLYVESISLFFIAILFIIILIWDWNKPKN